MNRTKLEAAGLGEGRKRKVGGEDLLLEKRDPSSGGWAVAGDAEALYSHRPESQ